MSVQQRIAFSGCPVVEPNRQHSLSGHVLDTTMATARPGGPGEIARLVHANGVIVVTRQVCSVGRRYAGQQVTVQVEPSVLHVFCDGVYLKTIPRTTTGEVTQVNAHRRNNHRPVR